MRVLHFYKTALPDSIGGVEQLIHQLARGAGRLGVDVEVLSLSREPGPPILQMEAYRLHRVRLDFELASTGFSLSALSRFVRLAERADLIHYHFPWPFMDVVHFLARVRKPTLLTYHSDIVRQRRLLQLYRPLQYRFLGDVDCIVATSPNYLASSEVLDRHRGKVRVIPIGLDRASCPQVSAERLAGWRNRLGPKFFLFVGVLRYYKGLHILIEAARGTGFPVVIVGAGPIEQDLRAQVARGGECNIHFLGLVSEEDKAALLQLSHAVVFPSHLRAEAFGISLLEGAMYGKPMISSEIGTGTTYINIGGETGLVVPPGDPSALRAAMRQLWEHPEQAREMGRQAERRYRQHFTADRMLDSYLEVYRQLCGK